MRNNAHRAGQSFNYPMRKVPPPPTQYTHARHAVRSKLRVLETKRLSPSEHVGASPLLLLLLVQREPSPTYPLRMRLNGISAMRFLQGPSFSDIEKEPCASQGGYSTGTIAALAQKTIFKLRLQAQWPF